MRSSSNIRTNANYGSNNPHNYEHVYNIDNSAVFYNTQGYPFGYNNHFISGNNYYGYPPSYTLQSDQQSARFNRQGGGGVYHSEAKSPASPQHNPTLDRRDRDREEEQGSAEGLDSANQGTLLSGHSSSLMKDIASSHTFHVFISSHFLQCDFASSPFPFPFFSTEHCYVWGSTWPSDLRHSWRLYAAPIRQPHVAVRVVLRVRSCERRRELWNNNA
jgi:hypothetical protein